MTATIHKFKSREQREQDKIRTMMDACLFSVDLPRMTFAVLQNAAADLGLSESELAARLVHEHLAEAHEAHRATIWPELEAGS